MLARVRTIIASGILLSIASVAAADPAPPPPPPITLAAWIETYAQWNLRAPSNGVTALRAFDERADGLALQNAVVDAELSKGALSGRLALQVGDAGDLYYGAERDFKNVQEAWAAWAAPERVELAAGLFLSPVGPETPTTRDQWNWSRSDLFMALPFYHLGVRVKRPLGDSGWTLMGMVCNGWNDIVDTNRTPSISLAAAYAKDTWIAQVLYFGGVERAHGAFEGQPWRHLGDAYVQGAIGGGFSFLAQVDAGVEDGRFGASSWIGGAAYLRYDVAKNVFVAARGDALREHEPAGASAFLIPAAWVSSGTGTISWRPVDGLDLRLEYRHDQAASAVYFGGDVAIDPTTGAGVPNRTAQDTITAGAIAWF
jgi:hypothetical protein